MNQTYGYYDCALKSLIFSWRRHFGCDDCFFAVVLLAAYTHDSTFSPEFIAPLRDCQLAALDLPKVAVVTATDLGDPGTAQGPGGESKFGSVHPRNKGPLGRRLAAAALEIRYGILGAAIHYRSPRFHSARVLSLDTENALPRVKIMFEPLPAAVLPLRALTPGQATTADPYGLSTTCPVDAGVPESACAGFSLQTSDGQWHLAMVSSIIDNGIVLTFASNGIDSNRSRLALGRARLKVVASRFGYGPWPINSVVTAGDVPLFPWQAWI